MVFNSLLGSGFFTYPPLISLLDALHLVFLVHAVYVYSVTEYGNIPALKTIFWSFKVIILLSPIPIVPYAKEADTDPPQRCGHPPRTLVRSNIDCIQKAFSMTYPDYTLIVFGCVGGPFFRKELALTY